MESGQTRKHWLDDGHLAFDDVILELYLASCAERSGTALPSFRLEKTRPMVEFYERRFGGAALANMLEVGVRYGGSVVLFHKMLRPAKLVAFDISPDRVAALDAYLEQSGAAGAVRVLYSVDQADGPLLRTIVADEFLDSPLDLVIDDGCHWLDETRLCFNALFPFLRAGGAYVIEDWSWAHWGAPEWQEGGGMWRDRPSLTPLVLELAMASASHPEVVESVHVRRDLVLVTKGGATLDRDFDLSDSYVTGGRRFVELLPGGPSRASLGRLRRIGELLRREGPAGVARRIRAKVGRALGRQR